PEFLHYSSGIVLQAYLPDAYQAMVNLQAFATQRVAGGGAPIKVRVVKGANLPMEQVQAAIHRWPQTVWPTKQDTDTNYKRILNYALTTERLANVHVGVAGQNLFDIALAYLLLQHRSIPVQNGPVDLKWYWVLAGKKPRLCAPMWGGCYSTLRWCNQTSSMWLFHIWCADWKKVLQTTTSCRRFLNWTTRRCFNAKLTVF